MINHWLAEIDFFGKIKGARLYLSLLWALILDATKKVQGRRHP
jgi:hypothetical protein